MKAIDRRALYRFLRYACVGISTFLFDLLLIYIATEFFGVPYYVSTPVAFWIALSINYALARTYVFKGTERKVHHGYGYYLTLAIAGAAAITFLVAFLVEYASFHYLIARSIVSGLVGMTGYLINLHFNFKVAGKH